MEHRRHCTKANFPLKKPIKTRPTPIRNFSEKVPWREIDPDVNVVEPPRADPEIWKNRGADLVDRLNVIFVKYHMDV